MGVWQGPQCQSLTRDPLQSHYRETEGKGESVSSVAFLTCRPQGEGPMHLGPQIPLFLIKHPGGSLSSLLPQHLSPHSAGGLSFPDPCALLL